VSSEVVFRGETHATNFTEEPTQQGSLLKVFVKPKFIEQRPRVTAPKRLVEWNFNVYNLDAARNNIFGKEPIIFWLQCPFSPCAKLKVGCA
jgi:hypothetical protein